jgi:outer membrane protein TolC
LLAAALAAAIAVVGGRATPHADPGDFVLRRLMQKEPDAGGASAQPAQPVTPTAIASWAGTPTTITMGELLTVAVRQSPALERARIDIAIAEARVLEARGVDDWRLGAEATGRRSVGRFAGVLTTSTDITIGADITRFLPTGGTLNLHAETSFSDTENEFMPSREWTDSVTATITHPLLRGRGSAIARAGVKRAALARDAAAHARRQAAIAAVQAIVAAHWDLALAERQLAIRRAGLDLIKERRRLTDLGIASGKVAQSELLAVDQAVATQEEAIVTAEVAVIDRSIALRRASGLTVEPGKVVLATGADATAKPKTATLDASLARAIEASPELAQLAISDKDAAIEVELAENGMLPRLDAALTLGPSGRDDRPSQAFVNMVTVDDYFISGTLTFEHDIGTRAAKGASRAARLGRERTKVDATDVRMQLAEAVARAVAQLELAARRIELSQTAIELAKKNIGVEQARFSLGKATNFDVLQRQDELQQAELRKAQAEIDARKAEATLSAVTGDLLDEYGVKLD